MNSKFLTAALVLFANSIQAQPSPAQSQASIFVQDFYDWYTPLASKNHNEPAFTIALKAKGSFFSSELAKALRDDAAAQEKAIGEIVGIDSDPFLNGQDPEPHYQVGEVKQVGSMVFVNVHGVRSGTRHSKPAVVAELTQLNGQWVFTNFHTPGGSDLLTVLKTLSKERQEPAK